MKTLTVLVFCSLLAISTSGCVTQQGQNIDSEQALNIVDGVTTKAEIESMFGKPDNKTTSSQMEI